MMKTSVCKIDEKLSGEELSSLDVIREAGAIIRAGGLVAFPTETVYGLGGNALDADASAKIYAAKGRPSDNPLIAHVADEQGVIDIVKEIPPKAERCMEAFWPGPLTMIFEKKEIVPYTTTGGLDTVAVRMPAHQGALALIRAAGVPIAAPSANRSGRPSPTTAKHVEDDLLGAIEMILDGGSADIGVESTIVDMTCDPPMILRPGYITQEMLQEVIGEVDVDPTITDANAKSRPKAPGMRYRHYAPKAPLTLVEDAEDGQMAAKAICICAGEAAGNGERVGIIGTEEYLEQYRESTAAFPNVIIKSIGRRSDPEAIAHNLYGVLREFDDEEVDRIFSESFESNHLGRAIMNRLSKAAGHQVICAEKFFTDSVRK